MSLNRADVATDEAEPLPSRGRIVLDAVAGTPLADPPGTHGFNLVEVTPGEASVTMWDGQSLRRVVLAPGTHMIAHDDVDDAATARIAAWRDDFAAPAVPDAPDAATDDGWREQWLDTLERTSAVGATDDRAPKGFAPIAIGLGLTLIHLISIPVTNTSVNPARSLAVAWFAGGGALAQM